MKSNQRKQSKEDPVSARYSEYLLVIFGKEDQRKNPHKALIYIYIYMYIYICIYMYIYILEVTEKKINVNKNRELSKYAFLLYFLNSGVIIIFC
jgi:hypothetical protein